MKQLFGVLLIGIITSAMASGQPAASTGGDKETYESLKTAYDEAFNKFAQQRREEIAASMKKAQEELAAAKKAVADAKTDKEKEAAKVRLQKASVFPSAKMIGPADGPGASFAPKFYDFAVKNPKSLSALDALQMALVTSGGANAKNGI